MKTLFLTLALMAVTSIAHARPLDTPDRALALQKKLTPKVLTIEGVNGIGIIGCNPRTGETEVADDFVHCVVIYTITEDTALKVKKLFPTGQKVKGVFVVTEVIGEIEPRPRITGGN